MSKKTFQFEVGFRGFQEDGKPAPYIRKFQIEHLGASEANEVSAFLLKRYGGAADLAGVLKNLEIGDLNWLIEKFRGVSKQETETGAFVPMTKLQFDDMFAGELGAQLDWLRKHMEVNFTSFFERMRTLMEEFAEKMNQ